MTSRAPSLAPRSDAHRSVSDPSAVADRNTPCSDPASPGSVTRSRTLTNPGSSTASLFRTFQRRRPSVKPVRRVSGVGRPTPLRSSARSTGWPGPSETRSVPSPPVTTTQPDGTWRSPEGRTTSTPPSSDGVVTGCGRLQPPRSPAATAQQISAPRRRPTRSPFDQLGRRGRGERRGRLASALGALHLARALEHHALVDAQRRRLEIALHPTGRVELDQLRGADVPLDHAVDDDRAGVDLGVHPRAFADHQGVLGKD